MTEETREHYRRQATIVFELTKGFTPEQRANESNLFSTMEEMAGYVLELTNDDADKRGYNAAVNDVIEINKNIIQKITEKFEQCDSNDGRIGFAAIIEAIEMHSEKLKEFRK
jgi:hypothetical protein